MKLFLVQTCGVFYFCNLKSTEAIPNPRLSVLSSAISMFNDSTHCCTVMLEFSQTFKAQFRTLNVWHNAKWIHDLNENTYLYY